MTSDGEIEADICVICTHKEPETTLARSMRLTIGSTGALAVDERMRTSMEGVYAAISSGPDTHCDACFTGDYPLEDTEQTGQRKDAFENALPLVRA